MQVQVFQRDFICNTKFIGFDSSTMFKVNICYRILSSGWNKPIRTYCSSTTLPAVLNPSKRICKIMMSCPKVGLENALDESGIPVSPELAEEVLERFENAGMLAYRFFEWAGKQWGYTHSVKAYHTMISSLAKIRQYQIMWDVVNNMRSKGLLNIETFSVIMRKYARTQKVEETIYTFNIMDKYGVTPNLAAFNSLLAAFCKSKNVRKAQEIFYDMRHRFLPNSKTYSILIEGWGRDPNLPKARAVYREMIDSGCEPDIVTYGIMVNVLCKAGRVEEAVVIVREMGVRGCQPTTFIYSALIHTYGTEKLIKDAVDTFLEMEQNGIKADVVAYNALICAFCKVNRLENAFRVLAEMEQKKISPNSRTCNTILNSLIFVGRNDEAFKFFRRMIKCCEPDSDTYTVMIKMFCDNDRLDKALKVWKYLSLKQFVPTMHTSSLLINRLCDKGELQQACVLLEEMIEKGIQPSGYTFGKLRHLLLKEKREDIVKFLLEKMNLLIKEPLCD